MKELIWFSLLGYLFYHYYIDDETGCEKYVSKYSCKYLEEKAEYDIYYWHKVGNGDPKDEKLIGTTIGLQKCRDFAFRYSLTINEKWNYRSYICILKRDGSYMEKHRFISD